MQKQSIQWAAMLWLFLWLPGVGAQDVATNITEAGAVVVTFTGRDCISNREGWDDQPYEVKYKKAGTVGWDEVFYVGATAPLGVVIGGVDDFDQGVEYIVKVRYYGLREDCRGVFTHIRTIGTTSFIYDHQEVVITDDHVRIQHIQSGKCLYTHTPGGLAATRAHNFTCWADPGMAFELLPQAGADIYRLRYAATGLCLRPVSMGDGDQVGVTSCGSSSSDFQLVPVFGDQFRLRSLYSNKCLYGTNVDGGLVHQWTCWDDPGMRFRFEEY